MVVTGNFQKYPGPLSFASELIFVQSELIQLLSINYLHKRQILIIAAKYLSLFLLHILRYLFMITKINVIFKWDSLSDRKKPFAHIILQKFTFISLYLALINH